MLNLMLTLSIHQTYLTNSTKKDILNMPHIHTEKGQHDHTASAFTLKHDIKKNEFRILLHMHKKYGKLLQPGGHIELHESPWEAILHELVEETGYLAKEMKVLMHGPISSGLTSETMTFIEGSGLCRVGAGGGDKTESIKVHEVSLDEAESWLRKMAKNGYLVDPKIYAGLYFLSKSQK